MFPFRGMPGWAQDIGEVLPLTHFLRIVRGILLKGNGLAKSRRTSGPSRSFRSCADHWHQTLSPDAGLSPDSEMEKAASQQRSRQRRTQRAERAQLSFLPSGFCLLSPRLQPGDERAEQPKRFPPFPAPTAAKPLKRLSLGSPTATGLKPGANERWQERELRTGGGPRKQFAVAAEAGNLSCCLQ